MSSWIHSVIGRGAFWVLLLGGVVRAVGAPPTIVIDAGASDLERLAAREVQRYAWLCARRPMTIEPATLSADGTCVVIATQGRPIVRAALGAEGERVKPLLDGYVVDVRARDEGRLILCRGSDDLNTLYAAYHLVRLLGARFALHGDIVPDAQVDLNELTLGSHTHAPLFATRGIQPFHDFPEGPDLWSVDDYKAVLAQLPKLRMNFIGLHTYPEGRPNAEPTVWIGPPNDIGDGVHVQHSYPACYFSTLRSGWNWGYGARETSDYFYGAATLFDRDCFGSDLLKGRCPQPDTAAKCNALFADTAAVLSEAFRFGRRLGVQSCVGTETPLIIPAAVRTRLVDRGCDPGDPNVVRELYRGVFERAAQAYPLDYYWFWTPEGWTWAGASDDEVQRTLHDLKLALAAYEDVQPPFKLATCGWVLGPQDDRTMFTRFLPGSVAVSCINRQVGHSPVDKSFARVQGRPQWAIPWLEDDHAMTTPQLWVGRMRRDALDARKYGCSGLLGIHWRTRVIGPNVMALADSAWDQSGWDVAAQGSGALDGSVAEFSGRAIAGTDDDVLYQTVRWGLTLYRVTVPPGEYTVRLHFSESHFAAPEQRVFGVTLQGERVIDRLDCIAEAGRDHAIVRTFERVPVPHGTVDIEFIPIQENPLIAAVEVIGDGKPVKLNCAGPAYGDFAAGRIGAFRFCPSDDFYRDWCTAAFGPAIADDAAAIFTRLDGHLPRPAGWLGGPGGIAPDHRLWDRVKKEYAFVDELAALRPQVSGVRSQTRFDYWLDSFRYLRSVARVRCSWGVLERGLTRAEETADPNEAAHIAKREAVPALAQLVDDFGTLHEHLYATISTPGALGNLVNWQQHTLPGLLLATGARVEKLIGEPLPRVAQPPKTYAGPPRLIVPTVRTSVAAGEALRVRALVLAEEPVDVAAVHCRALGETKYVRKPLRHVARGVYRGVVPAHEAQTSVIEYYVEVRLTDGTTLRYPPTAPNVGQTVVVLPWSE